VESGEITRLIITAPPRHSKSMTVSETFPSWFLGRNPTRRVIEVSYGDALAKKFGRANKNKIAEFGEDLFGVGLPIWGEGSMSATDWGLRSYDPKTGKIKATRGGMISRGIGGSITGEGADLLLIDDPIKNAEEAYSEAYREMVWNEYTSTLRTRLQPGGAIVIILTRWHEDDLVGRLLSDKERPDKWVVLSLAALAEDKIDSRTNEIVHDPLGRADGEPLWPEFGFDLEWAIETKGEVGSKTWESLYQQNPSIAEGSKVKRSWWKFYRELPTVLFKVQSWDTGLKEKEENDPSCNQTWAKCANGYYLVDRWKGKVQFPDLVTEMKLQYAKHNKEDEPVDLVIIEDATSGTQAAQTLARDTGLPLKAQGVGGRPKPLRVDAISALVESGKVFLPDPSYHQDARWVFDFLHEWSAFPYGAHDEDVDTTTQALEKLKTVDIVSIRSAEDYKAPPEVEIIKDERGYTMYREVKPYSDGLNGENGSNGKGDRYNSLIPKPHYLDNPQLAESDVLLNLCKEQDYVPRTCLLAGYIAMALVRELKDPCDGCNCDRNICRGRVIDAKSAEARR